MRDSTPQSTLNLLLAQYPGQLHIDTAQLAQVLRITPASIRTLRHRGKFRVPSIQGRGRHYDLRDVAEYLDGLRAQPRRRGPRTKAERARMEGGAA